MESDIKNINHPFGSEEFRYISSLIVFPLFRKNRHLEDGLSLHENLSTLISRNVNVYSLQDNNENLAYYIWREKNKHLSLQLYIMKLIAFMGSHKCFLAFLVARYSYHGFKELSNHLS
ncbi:hypothetical protein Pfo_020554 [Paulownia fortunei]|nr:hypothetical protein Pfo_020554 [Paulownia fortunei]